LGWVVGLLGGIAAEEEAEQGADDETERHGKAFQRGWPTCRAVVYPIACVIHPARSCAPSIVWIRGFVEGVVLAP
jgi:hypothetical protein